MKPGTDTVMVERLAVLEAYFMAREGVLLAYLYGSHARGTAGPLSDVDVAFLLERKPSARECFAARLEVTGALMDILGRDDVDVVVLNEAPPALAFRVIRDGVLLHARSKAARAEYVASVTIEYLDFQPCLALYERVIFERARRGELTRGPNPHRGALERHRRIAEGSAGAKGPAEGKTHR